MWTSRDLIRLRITIHHHVTHSKVTTGHVSIVHRKYQMAYNPVGCMMPFEGMVRVSYWDQLVPRKHLRNLELGVIVQGNFPVSLEIVRILLQTPKKVTFFFFFF